jgi:hypothetical protein
MSGLNHCFTAPVVQRSLKTISFFSITIPFTHPSILRLMASLHISSPGSLVSPSGLPGLNTYFSLLALVVTHTHPVITCFQSSQAALPVLFIHSTYLASRLLSILASVCIVLFTGFTSVMFCFVFSLYLTV